MPQLVWAEAESQRDALKLSRITSLDKNMLEADCGQISVHGFHPKADVHQENRIILILANLLQITHTGPCRNDAFPILSEASLHSGTQRCFVI